MASTSDSATTSTPLTLTLSSELLQLASSVEHALSALVSIKAPESAPTARQPLELVAVVDRSGSMSGSKMKAMKEALMFLVSHGLQKDDKFALVAFDNNVDLRLPVMTMDAAGKKKAVEMVTALNTGGSTNLSGGLLKGIDVLSQAASSANANANANRAVLLFTDGIANNGITDSAGIVAAAQGAMVSSPCTVFTFGFGGDHSESLLRNLSEQTNGLYYYVEKSEDIPVSFADCLGGLVSVVAQNAVLRIDGLDGGAIAKAHCHYKHEETDSPGSVSLALGDIYAEDEKDVLLTVKLPPLPQPRPEAAAAVRAQLRYFSVSGSCMESVTAELAISRPDATPAGQPMPQRLAEQRERIAVSEALAAASDLADRGQIAEGRAMLQEAVAHAKASPCAASPIVSNIVKDAMAVEEGYSDAVAYRSYGSKMSKMSAMSHMQQRSTHSSGVAYERKSKMAMKSMFAASAPPLPPSPPSPPSPSSPLRAVQQAPAAQFVQAPPTSVKAKKKAIFKMPSLGSFRGSSTDAQDLN